MSDQGGAFGNLKIDQDAVTVKGVVISEDDAPLVPLSGLRLYVDGSGQLHTLAPDTTDEQLTGVSGLSGTAAVLLDFPQGELGIGDGETLVGTMALAAADWSVTARGYNDTSYADAAETFIRLRNRATEALLLEFTTEATSETALAAQDLSLATATIIDVYVGTDEPLGVGVCNQVLATVEET